jgi:type II secretory pathway predicted ATPase ExeA
MTENTDSNLLKNLLANRGIKPDSSKQFEKLGLSFNPFPRAGISDLNSTPYLIGKLEPIDDDVKKGVEEFIIDSLSLQNTISKDKYISAVIRGDYGLGKTQTLLYAKYILELFNQNKELNKRPYVVYIDNPGAKLTELIGAIISQIGEENFKRYLWNIAFEKIATNKQFKKEILEFRPRGLSLFDDETDPFDPVNLVSYKSFLDAWYSKILNAYPKKKKEFQDKLKGFVISIFTTHFDNTTIAMYFYDLLAENIGINKTWEALTTGSAKELDKKEVYIIRAIVKLIESQGYTDFYILVDEFENVTAGRLSPIEIDRYVTNLRALIDKERNWCSLFAMTPPALQRLKSVSPPLAERISSRIIDLKSLNDERAKTILINYLNLAREESLNLFPFDETAITALRTKSHGILRVFLKSCFSFIQRALEELKEGQKINEQFVTKHFQIEEE